MRVLVCKFQCPSFVCFCKSPVTIFSPGSLKLENAQNVPSSLPSLPDAVARLRLEKVKNETDAVNGEAGFLPKSSLRKTSCPDAKEVAKKAKVQWMDFVGKELVEVKEFEPSESGDSDDDANDGGGCLCVIQ